MPAGFGRTGAMHSDESQHLSVVYLHATAKKIPSSIPDPNLTHSTIGMNTSDCMPHANSTSLVCTADLLQANTIGLQGATLPGILTEFSLLQMPKDALQNATNKDKFEKDQEREKRSKEQERQSAIAAFEETHR
jgi:hypothetical protein